MLDTSQQGPIIAILSQGNPQAIPQNGYASDGAGEILVGSGNTILVSVKFNVPAAGASVTITGNISFEPNVGSTTGGSHSMLFTDALESPSTLATFSLDPTTSFLSYNETKQVTVTLHASGYHTLNLVYFSATTGVGQDTIHGSRITASVTDL